MKITDKIEITNEDNMTLMSRYEDNYFDLAIIDPPYGGNDAINLTDNKTEGKQATKRKKYHSFENKFPKKEFFDELFRVSKNQIIWGANHFIERINKNSSCWIVWNKKTAGNNADCELAWSSFKTAVRRFDFMWEGFWQENMKDKEKRIHPTQKPVALYDWLLHNYAKENAKILDTHFGSGSIALAVDKANRLDKMNLHLTAVDIDKEYIDKAIKRISESIKQGTLSF